MIVVTVASLDARDGAVTMTLRFSLDALSARLLCANNYSSNFPSHPMLISAEAYP